MGILQKVASFFGGDGGKRLYANWVNGQLVLLPRNGDTYINEGYLTNAQVYAVINWIMRKGISVPFDQYDIKDQSAFKQYKALTSGDFTKESLINSQILKVKALKPSSKESIRRMLDKPNEKQTGAEFRQWFMGFRLIMGEAFVQNLDGIGGKFNGAWPLHPKEVEIELGKQYLEVLRYIWTGGGARVPLPPENCYHSKYFNPTSGLNGDNMRGLSPLGAMLNIVQESNEYTKQSLAQSQNAGPAHIVSAKADMGIEEGSMLKDAIQTKWRESNRVPFVTSAQVDVQALGLSPADLQLLEGRLFTLRTLCDGYGVPSEIFNDPNNKTYANKNEAKKSAILDAVVPELIALRDYYNTFAEKEGVYVDFDVSLLPEMQEDMEKMANALEKQPYATYAEKRQVMKWGEDVRPDMQNILTDYMIPSGVTPSKMLVDATLQTDPTNDGSIV